MKNQFVLAFIFFGVLGFIAACEKAALVTNNYLDQADCSNVNSATNTYNNTIKAILDTNCASSECHNAAYPSEGIDLSTYAKAKSAFENKTCLCAIHHGSECSPMPQSAPKLSDADIQKIDCWAKNGYAQ